MKHNRLLIFLVVLIIGFTVISGRAACVGGGKSKAKSGSSTNSTFIINVPSNLTATAVSFSQINLSWQDNSNNEDGFEIWRSADGINYELIITTTANTYSDIGLSSFITYYYRIRGFNRWGDPCEYSNVSSAFTFDWAWVPTTWSQIAAGMTHSVAIGTNGTVWSWGLNDWWQLGIGDTDSLFRTMPTLIEVDFSFNPFADIISVVGGRVPQEVALVSHSLALKSDRTLWAWGSNTQGQLGFGDTSITIIEAPDQVGSDSDWSIISAGGGYSIALKTNLTLWAWGYNLYGQLGDGTQTNRWTPLEIGADSDWASIAGSQSHAIARKTNNTLWSWGYNGYGQLGDGTQTDRWTPRQIGTDSDWLAVSGANLSAIAAGYNNTIAIKTDFTLWAWGYNQFGQLGDGTTTDRWTPRQIGTTSDWSMVTAGGYWTFGLKTNRTIWAWGYNTYGQLGLGDTGIDRNTPTQIGTDSDWSSIAGGENHTIGLKTNGSLWAWGTNYYGQLGLGDTMNRNTPTNISLAIPPYLPPSSFNANIISSSQVNLSWIDSTFNEIGFKIERQTGLSGTFEQIATVNANVTSYSDTGLNPDTPYYYRIRAYNTFGDGLNLYSSVITPILFAPSFLTSTLVSSFQFNLYWTDNSIDEYGFKIERKKSRNGTWTEINTVNANVTSYSDITSTGFAPNTTYYYRIKAYNAFDSVYSNEISIALSGAWFVINANGNSTIIARITNNTIWAWGNNNYGKLGVGDTINRYTPTQIGTDSDWTLISPGDTHTVGLKANGTIYSWGRNNNGQLGLGNTINRNSPTQVGTDSDWSVIVANVLNNGANTFAIKANRTVWSWGSNYYGHLGLGGTGNATNRNSPTQIGTDSDWVLVIPSVSYTIAKKTNNTLWAWGNNLSGQLGLGDTIKRSTPTQIGTDSDWSAAALATEDGSSFSLKTNGTLWGWGYNSFGQLGLGYTTPLTTGITAPTQIGTNSDWSVVKGGWGHSIAIKTNGMIWSWGQNDNYGQLGLGDTINRTTPSQVGTDSDWVQVSGSNYYNIGLKTSGTLWSWGRNTNGNLGLGDMVARTTPTQIENGSDWISITTVNSSCGLKSNNTLWSWGSNYYGDLGLGDTINRNTPTLIGE
jgi:alpha-tubulin suppressor-like RCC1 family protein